MAGSHWKSAVDPRTGRTYYYHEVTRETQWRKPMELASDRERKAMEDKERKQKDFFAAMEANILNSLSQGQVPGSPKKPLERRQSSKKPAEHPDLVRTISTMDHMVLKNLISRQPSFRAVPKKSSLEAKFSINPADLEIPSRGSTILQDQFESFVSIKSERERLDPLEEANHDSMPELFDYLPDEGELSLEGSAAFGDDRSDGGEFNKSSLSGFGLNWEETQALKKLASITKEMIEVEKEEDGAGTKSKIKAGSTPTWKARDSKGMRDLPREIELDDEEDEEGDTLAPMPNSGSSTGNFQKAKSLGGRELDFEDSDEDDESPASSQPAAGKKSSPADEMKRPEIKRRNTCGTMYVGTTMSAPDKDATIKCVCGVLRTHILSSEQLPHESEEFLVFNDLESHQQKQSFKFHNDDHKSQVPSLEEISRFYRDIFYKAQMETDCIIMSLIYVERLVKKTGGKLRPRASNWRSLIFSCMILSSKVWDDLSMWNADFSQSCPPGVKFSLQRINQLELAVLHALNFQVKVPASEYAKYYFLLRSMLIKSGLGGEKFNALDPLDVMGARRLQQVSSQFENLSLESKTSALSQRSQSLNVAALSSKRPTHKKLGLEQVVKM